MPAHRSPLWTAHEIAILRKFYSSEGVNCVNRLPKRTWKSVHQKAFKLGLKCERLSDAPKPKLEGDALEEALSLREDEGWAFARIGAHFGVSESAACNAVLIALCPIKGYKPAERDVHGRLTERGLERVRYALKKGLKGQDIQLRLGVSASCVAEQRRRYNRDLKSRGKATLPPPGGGEAYSGVKVSLQQRRKVEAMFLEGFGTLKISDATGVSKTSCTRIRKRLVARLRKQGQALPGCDLHGKRHSQKASSRFVPSQAIEALRVLLLERMPVQSAARLTAIGQSTAYRLRDELRAELEAKGQKLPSPIRTGRRAAVRSTADWPPQGASEIFAFRELLEDLPLDEARAEWRRRKAEARKAEAARPKTFEEQLQRVREGKIGIVRAIPQRHLEAAIPAEQLPA